MPYELKMDIKILNRCKKDATYNVLFFASLKLIFFFKRSWIQNQKTQECIICYFDIYCVNFHLNIIIILLDSLLTSIGQPSNIILLVLCYPLHIIFSSFKHIELLLCYSYVFNFKSIINYMKLDLMTSTSLDNFNIHSLTKYTTIHSLLGSQKIYIVFAKAQGKI